MGRGYFTLILYKFIQQLRQHDTAVTFSKPYTDTAKEIKESCPFLEIYASLL